ncbi:MAG: LptF/LptG family permease, partial [Pricia sp.]
GETSKNTSAVPTTKSDSSAAVASGNGQNSNNPASPKTDALQSSETTGKNELIDLYKDWQKLQLMNSAKNSVANILTSVSGKNIEMDKRYEIHRRHIFSLHDKYALALSCIILFFVGAPLGAIIRKGGIGLPMVTAILLFLAYYFLGVFSENYSYKGNIHPILGAWIPSMIMLPLGVYLTKRATADKGMMNFGNALDRLKRVFKKKDENTVTA